MYPEELTEAMDATSQWVALVAGVKAQLVNAGWSEAMAEQLGLEFARAAGRV